MAVGLAITRHDESADDLRRLARRCGKVAQARRLLAVALVMEGHPRTVAATAVGMDRQALRDWVHRFDAEGPEGSLDKLRGGRAARSSADQLQALDAIVEAGPDVGTDGVVRWCCVDLQRVIAERCDATLCRRSVGRISKDRGFRHVSVRPRQPRRSGHVGPSRTHWVLDVTFKEDQSRTRKGHGARNMAVVRHFGIDRVRQTESMPVFAGPGEKPLLHTTPSASSCATGSQDGAQPF